MDPEAGLILIVDDVEANRDLLARRLQRYGHQIKTARDGREAIACLNTETFDLILCDIMMPDINGYEVLEYLKADPNLRHIPVIMISALEDTSSVVRCIELGAEDYLSKPFNPTLLKARINACLEKKRLRDQEQTFLKQLQAEQARSEQLLLSILPAAIAEQLKQGQSTLAESYAEASVLFADIADFTEICTRRSAIAVVKMLNQIFSAFDQLADRHGLEKIKTIGDAYMVVSGVPVPRADHAAAMANMALDMLTAIEQFNSDSGECLKLRIGMSTGPVVAGVIGTRKFAYDLWGDTVNTASRMESHGIPGCIQVTESTYQQLQSGYRFEARGLIPVKGKGSLLTYLLKEKLVLR
jgi:adenylate cyclase